MRKSLPLLLALTVFSAACAGGAAQRVDQTAPYTLNRPDLLCADLINKIAIQERPYRYNYQRTILQAAGVGRRDSPEEVARKVQELFRRHEDRLVCNNQVFPVRNGNLLKLGIYTEFDAFINDVLAWGVNLNRIDQDNKTVLDFIRDQQARYEGTSAERKLRRYYERFREAGALHRSELP